MRYALVFVAALSLSSPAHASFKHFCERWLVTPASTGADARARTLVIELRDHWYFVDDALALMGSIRRTGHGLDRMLGRSPQGKTDVEERAEYSAELLHDEWAKLHPLDPNTVRQCLDVVDKLECEPALATRLRAAFTNARLSEDEYLSLPSNQARLTGPWAAVATEER